ncbi:hypothetical protein B0H13DRAFT_2331620 [Mycena leptocephala]|nr:hypothetical protein B0H13DRAFT_2331620 [Mycena leptocephala]
MLPLLPLVLVSYFLLSCRAGQLASSSWRRPNITISPADRISIADAAIEKAISMLGPDAQFDGQSLGYAGQLYSQMAEFDIATNQTKYADTLKQYFLQAPHRQTNFSDVFVSNLDFALAYGHAAATAYAAYKDQVFLDYAIQSWWFGQTFTLSSQQVAAGNTSVKNFTISNRPSDPFIAALGTGNFFVLSALLAEMTSDSSYLQAATDSANFIKDHLMNSLFQVQDGISARGNESCATNSLAESHNAGLAIEGLSILYSKTRDPATQTLLNNILNATVLDQSWQQSNGVLTEGDVYLLRGLTTFYVRRTTPDLLDDIGHYITVQFNAVTDLATANGSNVYSNSWTGPPSSAFYPTNQSNAISALLGAINLRNDSDTSTSVAPAPTATQSPGTVPRKSSKIGPIIGGIFATVALMAGALSIWVIQRRRFRSSSAPKRTSSVSPFGIWYNLRHRGKRARDALGESPETVAAPPFSKAAAVPRRAAPVVTVPVVAQNSSVSQPSSNLPTEELVRILNERLQGQDWDAEEAPPEYPV